MTDCCTSVTSKNTPLACPDCGTLCKPVSLQTVLHQVIFPKNLDLKQKQYYFCHTLNCQTGYFSLVDKITQQFLRQTQQIKEHQLCYCFDISTVNYQSALANNTAQKIKNFVTEKTKTGLCACEIQNPSGQCCLAKFKQLETSFF